MISGDGWLISGFIGGLSYADLGSLVAHTYDVGAAGQADADSIAGSLALIGHLAVDGVDGDSVLSCAEDGDAAVGELYLHVLAGTDIIDAGRRELDVVRVQEGIGEVVVCQHADEVRERLFEFQRGDTVLDGVFFVLDEFLALQFAVHILYFADEPSVGSRFTAYDGLGAEVDLSVGTLDVERCLEVVGIPVERSAVVARQRHGRELQPVADDVQYRQIRALRHVYFRQLVVQPELFQCREPVERHAFQFVVAQIEVPEVRVVECDAVHLVAGEVSQFKAFRL